MLIACLALLLLQPLPRPDTLAVDVGEAIRLSLEVSPEVRTEIANQEFAEARYGLARASRFATEFSASTAHAVAPGLTIPDAGLPTDELYLDPDVRNDWEDLRPYNRLQAELAQPIYTWGQLGGSIRAARYGIAVEEAGVRSKALEVALRAGESYYGLLLTEELYRLTERAGEIVQQAKREIGRLLEEGAQDVDDADLFQVQITEQEYLRRVTEVTQQRMTARTALRRQLFVGPDQVVVSREAVLEPLAFEPDSLEHYFEVALQMRPEISEATAGLEAREALVEVARSDYYPKLFAGVQANYAYAAGRFRQPNPYINDPFLSRSLRAGLSFRQQLNFAQTRARVEQAEAQRNEVGFQLEAARQLILFEVEEAYRNLLIARTAFETQREALRISGEWLQTEYINFDLDLGDTENLVRAVQANLQLEAGYYEAVRRYNVAVLRLLRATGTLVPRAESGTLVD